MAHLFTAGRAVQARLVNQLAVPVVACVVAVGLGSPRQCQADIVADVLARCPSTDPSFDDVLRRLSALEALGARVGSLGSTHCGRPIPVVVVGEREPASSPPRRLFIIARQHGAEPSGTAAALALAEHFARAERPFEREISRRLTLVIVPVANPDGMVASRRSNARGVDLNRDWASLSQPETRAIAQAVAAWRPDAILDLHDLPMESSRAAYQENFVQTIGKCSSLPAELWQMTTAVSRDIAAWMKYYQYGMNVYYDSPGESLLLCHRYFGLGLGYPTFLCEAKRRPGMSLPQRAGFHVLVALVVGNALINSGAPAPRPAPPPVTLAAVGAASKAPAAGAPAAEPPRIALQAQAEATEPAEVRLQAQLTPGEGLGYMTLSVNGRIRSLTNSPSELFVIGTGGLPDGSHEVVVAAYDCAGTLITEQPYPLTLEDGRPLVAE